MSAIYGILNLDSQAAAPENLDRMRDALTNFSSDGSRVYSEGGVSLGHVARFNTPESLSEVLPVYEPAAQLSLTASARLDNRTDLFRQFNVSSAEQATFSDSALILLAYQTWGVHCPKYLLGKWAFALWDSRQRLLFIARDQLCGASLYYYQDKQRFIFSTSLKGILALPDIPHQLNEVAIAQLSVGNKRDAATFYKGIYQLTPGQSLSVTAEKTTRNYYWHPSEITDIRFSSDEDYIDAFLEIFQNAVSCRLRSFYPVATTLSSGFDSGSIAAIASRELAQKGQRLHSVSWRPRSDFKLAVDSTRTADENPFIQEMAAFAGNIDTGFAYALDSDPLTSIRKSLDILDQPDYIIPTYYWFIAILRAAQEQNVGTLLAGSWGNFTISWGGDRKHQLAQLLRNGHWGKFRDEVFSLTKQNPSSVLRILKYRLLQPLYSLILQGQQQAPHRLMVRPEAARAIHPEHLMIDSDLETMRRQAAQPLSAIYNMFQSGNTAITSELGRAFNVDVRTPPIDKRIVEFCLGIPQDQYIRGNQKKLLIRRSMAGLMPQSILSNKKRGVLAVDQQHLIRANQDELKQILIQFDTSELIKHWLDVPQMKETFNRLQHPINSNYQLEFGILMRGVTIGLFLQRFE